MNRALLLMNSVVILAALSATASAAGPVVQARGGGHALVTDPDGNEFSASFAISGMLNPKGTAHGSVNFVFGPEFSDAWGAVPGVDAIHVWEKVTSITKDDGTVILEGTVTEVDISRGGGVLVFEDEPFKVVISGPGQFTFTWCLLPVFDFEVTDGNLVVL